MRISFRDNDQFCRNCDRRYPLDHLDRRMWCPDCRREVIRRATRVARIVAFVTAAALAIWVFSMVGPESRFLVFYMVMIAAAYLFIYKLTQRVAFEIIRERGVPPPELEEPDDP